MCQPVLERLHDFVLAAGHVRVCLDGHGVDPSRHLRSFAPTDDLYTARRRDDWRNHVAKLEHAFWVPLDFDEVASLRITETLVVVRLDRGLDGLDAVVGAPAREF